MWNLVSVQWFAGNEFIEWFHKITAFEVLPRYIPLGRDTETDPGLPPMGINNDQLPQDLNVTFFIAYEKGEKLCTFEFF